MKHYTVLLATITVLAILSGCDRPGDVEDPTGFDKDIDGMTSGGSRDGLSEGLLADQAKIASNVRRRNERARPAPPTTQPTAPHLLDTGIGKGGVGTPTGGATTDTGNAGTGTGGGDTTAGTGTTGTGGTDTGTGTGTDTGTDTGTGTGGGSVLDGIIPPAEK